EIIRVTEASPLFLEDLVRLFAVLPVDDAIKRWEERTGHEARKYALGRELELLSEAAKHVLLAACVESGAVSFPELEAVTGLPTDQVISALGELQRLFLIPKPRLIEGEQRFDVNLNTKSLVKRVMSSTDVFRRVEAAQKSRSGLPSGNKEVSAII